MKHYSTFVLEQFGKHIHGDIKHLNWLIDNNYRELHTLDANCDDKNGF